VCQATAPGGDNERPCKGEYAQSSDHSKPPVSAWRRAIDAQLLEQSSTMASSLRADKRQCAAIAKNEPSAVECGRLQQISERVKRTV